jgi:hypothetical protein
MKFFLAPTHNAAREFFAFCFRARETLQRLEGKRKTLGKFSVNYAIKARRSIGKSAHERCNHEGDLKALRVVNNRL